MSRTRSAGPGQPWPGVFGTTVSRRTFLGSAAATGLGIVLVGCSDAPSVPAPPARIGPLVPDPDGLLSLPEGFRYRVVARSGVTRLDSGELAPLDPDGAATFPALDGNGTVLVCNHEIEGMSDHPVPHVDGLVYDDAAHGGTTTLVLDAEGNTLRHHVSLAGTSTNCAGGRTPWNTWLSCEETSEILGRRHGYVFEVDPYDEAANRDPRPITALGRYAHEAVAVDPDRHVFYLTEDATEPNGLLYRWTPPEDRLPLGKGSLRRLGDEEGALHALRALTPDGRHVRDLSEATEVGTTWRTEWVEVADRDAVDVAVRQQFADSRITRARKLEGMWWGDGGAYVVSSFARPEDGSLGRHDGQVWFLDPGAQTLSLRLRFAPTQEPDAPHRPDNISVSPYGGVLIAEDHDGRVHLLGATPDGTVFALARSEVDEPAEFCGPVFSPDGLTLFANLQGPGCTFAIRGPFG